MSSIDLSAGAWLFAQTAAFERGVKRAEDFPPADRIEIALCGRSNVGKSSLLNALTGRRSLARVSHTPGRTREINFFRIPADSIGLYLVDLPGYGHADAPKRKIAGWNRLMEDYLKGRATLRRVFLLIDARHGIKETDLPFFETFDESAVSYQIVLTKIDKTSAEELAKLQQEIPATLRQRPAAHPDLLATSATTGQGIAELRAAITGLIDLAPLGYKGSKRHA